MKSEKLGIKILSGSFVRIIGKISALAVLQ